MREAQARVLARLLPRVRDVRRLGAAALDLAWAAAGRVDAYYERGVHHWDVAAGALICARAGLAVRELAPAPPAAAGLLVGAARAGGRAPRPRHRADRYPGRDSNPHGHEGPMAFEAIVSDQFHHPGRRWSDMIRARGARR